MILFKKNDHREAIFIPPTTNFVDEYHYLWYIIGVEWINYGLKMYIAIYYKPESGCEIQYAANGDPGKI